VAVAGAAEVVGAQVPRLRPRVLKVRLRQPAAVGAVIEEAVARLPHLLHHRLQFNSWTFD
jgi:hypothetical protein